jgi:hypothetical protein
MIKDYQNENKTSCFTVVIVSDISARTVTLYNCLYLNTLGRKVTLLQIFTANNPAVSSRPAVPCVHQ